MFFSKMRLIVALVGNVKTIIARWNVTGIPLTPNQGTERSGPGDHSRAQRIHPDSFSPFEEFNSHLRRQAEVDGDIGEQQVSHFELLVKLVGGDKCPHDRPEQVLVFVGVEDFINFFFRDSLGLFEMHVDAGGNRNFHVDPLQPISRLGDDRNDIAKSIDIIDELLSPLFLQIAQKFRRTRDLVLEIVFEFGNIHIQYLSLDDNVDCLIRDIVNIME
jgi:hypothetical protein